MAEPKTRPTAVSVDSFLGAVTDEERRGDCLTMVKIMQQATRARPKMWGPSIVGFGEYHQVYASGREGDWPLIGFSPSKRELTVYIATGFARRAPLMARLWKCRTGKVCVYIKRLADIDLEVLKDLVAASVEHTRRVHPTSRS